MRQDHPEWTDLNNAPAVGERLKNAQKERAKRTEVSDKVQRNVYTAAYRAKIIAECKAARPGQKSAILRREGLYMSTLTKWQAQSVREFSSKADATEKNPLEAENLKLLSKLAKAERSLKAANELIDLQKKISDILGVSLQENAAGE